MAELQTQVNRLEVLLTNVQKRLETLATQESEPRRRKPRARSNKTTEWKAILTAFSELRSDMENLKISVASHSSSALNRKDEPVAKDGNITLDPKTVAQLGPTLLMARKPTKGQEERGCSELIPSSQTPNSRAASSPLSEVDSEMIITPTSMSSATSQESASPVCGSSQTMSIEDMGPKLVDTLTDLASSVSFSGKITIHDLYQVEWADIASQFLPKQQFAHLAVEYRALDDLPGCVSLVKARSRQFKIPNTPTTSIRPTIQDITIYLDKIVRDPPRSPLAYYVGPQLIPSFGHLLHSGPELAKLDDIPGVNSVYDHLGERGSGTAFHHEDAHFWSCNLTLFGWKAWILVREHHTAKFEDFVRSLWPDKCDQFVRHYCLLFAPSSLRHHGIEFDIHCTGPGDLMVTRPRQYHAVINYSDSYAISTNFLPAGEAAIPSELRVCPECGLNDLYKQTKTATQKTSSLTKATSRLKANTHERQNSKLIKALDNRGQTENRNIPSANTTEGDSSDHQRDHISKLAMAIRSKSTLSQFCSLVAARRSQQDNGSFRDTNDYEEGFAQCVSNLNSSETGSDLQKLRVRLDQIRLVDNLENTRSGQLRCTSEVKQRVLKRFNWTESRLEDHQKKGNKWRKICGPFPGLLCFMFPQRGNVDKIKQKDYFDLASDSAQLEAFHRLLRNNYVQSLCIAGKALQDSLMGGSSLDQFKWEMDNIEIWNLDEEEVLPYMAPYHGAS